VFLLVKRATLLVPSGPSDHLHIVLNDPYGRDGEVLLASIRSVDPDSYYDSSCVLHKGDHPFLKHPSWVDYARLLLEHKVTVEKAVKAGIFKQHQVCPTETHARICHGLQKSTRVAPRFLAFYNEATAPKKKS